jgi:hypothetical protein
LMIAQTLSNPLPERALLPNERIVQLGTFEDILNGNLNSRTLAVDFELEMSEDDQEVYFSDNEEPMSVSEQKIKFVKIAITFHNTNQLS